MREIRDEEADSLLECSPEDQRYLEFLETNREKRMKKMVRRLRWISLKKQFFTVAPRTMRFAVAALGILCIGLTTAFASSETFRVRVFLMFAEDHGQYTAIGLREDEQKAFDVPNGWEGMYYPTYIPDGFEVINVENLSEQIFLISFENKNNEYIKKPVVNISIIVNNPDSILYISVFFIFYSPLSIIIILNFSFCFKCIILVFFFV